MRQAQPAVTGRTLAMPAGPHQVEKATRTRTFSPPPPKKSRILLRMLAWMWTILRFSVLRRLMKPSQDSGTLTRQARRLAARISAMGGAAEYISKQAGMRLDLLPREFAVALSELQDKRPPMPIEIVVEKVEAAVGVPLAEFFEVFDPQPIASHTVDCVYQGVLRSGEKVAVRVLRPGAIELVNTEVHAFRWVIGVLRHVIPERGLLLQRIHDEAPQVLLQGVDFVRVARLHRLMKKELKRWRFKEVGVAKVFLKHSTEDVIISQFTQGVWLHEVIGAVERNDEVALARLEEMEIRPADCARRLLRFSWWATLESYVLLSAPQASQLIVRPGGKVVVVDLGIAVTMSRHQRRLLMATLESFAGHDIEKASDLLLDLFSPLPPVDADELTARVRGALWAQLVAVERKDSPWWERSPASIWLALFEVLRGYGVNVSMELDLAAQAQCVFGHLAFRMRPQMRLLREFRRYRHRAIIRGAKRVVREFGNPKKDGGSRFLARPTDILNLQERALLGVESALEKAPMTYLSMTHKGAASFAEMLRMVTSTILLATVILLVKGGIAWWNDRPFDLVAQALQLMTEPLFIVILVFLAVVAIRRILFRLDDVDRDD